MPDYRQMYFRLFVAMADAVEAMERLDFANAKKILIEAQQAAEEMYITAGEREK